MMSRNPAAFSTIVSVCILVVPVVPRSSSALESTADSTTERFVSLFDGETISGWEGDTESTWRIESGALVAGSLERTVPRNEFLATTREYGDFELRLKYKLVGTEGFVNGGVQFRSRRIPNRHEVSGYQADLGHGYDGHLYDESRRNRMLASPPKQVVSKALRPDDWNDYRIRAQGARIQLWLNGVPTVDYTEKDAGIARKGVIALQIHGGCKAIVRYKEIEIRELGATRSLTPAVGRFGNREDVVVEPRGPFPERRFALAPRDVVAFTGQTDVVRSRQDATLESLLTLRFAAERPAFRNLAWEGDTVYEQWRDLNFGSWEDQLASIGATVVLAQFGQVEALEGAGKVPEFVRAYEELLDRFAASTQRVVLISPRPFEEPVSPHVPNHVAKNEDVRHYVEAIRALAERRRYVFVDLFAPIAAGRLASRLTTNGIHLTPTGQSRVAVEIAGQLQVPVPPAGLASFASLRTAIVEKNRLWFDNWRPMNWSFAFGDRTGQPFGKPHGERPALRVELEAFKPLIEEASRRIEELARALQDGRSVRRPATPAEASRTPRPPRAEDPEHSVEKELASFTVADGFTINVFASESDGIVKPLQMRWDDRNRLWVLCAPTYPHIDPGARPGDYVLVCEDTDRDGRADRFRRFAEGLFMPMGIEFGNGGVYLAEATELVHLADTDGDGRADSRRVLLSGFGTADSHQMINGLTWGPGGALWFTQGHHVYSHVETPWGIARLHKSGVWRYRPRTGRLNGFFNLSTAGLNCQGVNFNDWGQIFHNSAAYSGGFYTVPGMIPTLNPRKYWAMAVPDRRNTGIEFVGTRHLPDELQGSMVWGGFMSNSVQLHRLLEEQSGFTAAVIPDLVKSSRRDFRPVNVRIGPDGAIYICDWYNAIIGHYQASYRDPNRDRSHGRIWRVTATDRPLVKPPDLTAMSPAKLLDQLRSPERLTRFNARRRLFDLPTIEAIEATDAWLSRLDSSDPEHERLLVEAIGIYEAHEVVRPDRLLQLLNADDPRARAYGTRVVGNWADRLPEPLAILEERIRDEHPRVRLEAVVACSHVPSARTIEVASRAVDMPLDRFLRYALSQAVKALKPWWHPALSRGELRFDGEAERLRFVLEADGTRDVAGFVRQLCINNELSPSSRERLLGLLINVGSPDDLRFAWDRAPDQIAVLDELATVAIVHGRRPGGDLVASLEPLLDRDEPALRAAAVRLIGAWRIRSLAAKVRRVLMDADTPEVVVLAALIALASLEDRDALALLETFSSSDRRLAVRTQAIAAIVRVDVGRAADDAAALLSEVNTEGSASEALAPFLSRRGGTAALASALRGARLPADRAKLAHRALSAAGRSDPELLTVLNEAIGIDGEAPEYDVELVRTLAAEAMSRGDAGRGREVFSSKLANCTACHRVGDVGSNLGPDLSIVGAGRSPELLVESVLWPNRQIREGYMSVLVITNRGRVYTGYRLKETDAELLLRDTTTNQVRRIARADIQSLTDAGSVMPAGLTTAMTRDELRDLIRYISSLGRR